MIIKFGSRIIRTIIMLMLAFFTVTGSDCEKVLVNNGSIPSQMVGTWKLVDQSGALMDICPEETAVFQSDGIANLTCPNSTSVSRSYSVSNNVLTYTQSGVQYDYEFLNNNTNLAFYGKNVSRNLIYEKIITSDISGSTYKNESSHNSSEAAK